MFHSEEAILADIEGTLDQLILNAEAVSTVSLDTLHISEVDALRKTQESLLARLIHMNTLLDEEKKKSAARRRVLDRENLEKKMAAFGRMNQELMDKVSSRFRSKENRMKKIHLPRNRRTLTT